MITANTQLTPKMTHCKDCNRVRVIGQPHKCLVINCTKCGFARYLLTLRGRMKVCLHNKGNSRGIQKHSKARTRPDWCPKFIEIVKRKAKKLGYSQNNCNRYL